MKKSGLFITLLAMLGVLAGCRGGNSTYTTAATTAMTTAMTTQMTTAATTENAAAQTPTINNGNGPVTTAAPEDNTMANDMTEGAETKN